MAEPLTNAEVRAILEGERNAAYDSQFSEPNAQMLPASVGFNRRVLSQFFKDKAEIEAEQRRMRAEYRRAIEAIRCGDPEQVYAVRHAGPGSPRREWIESDASKNMTFERFLELSLQVASNQPVLMEERPSQPPPMPASRDLSPDGVKRDVESVIDHLLNDRTTAAQRRGLESATEQGNRVKKGSNEALGRAISGRPPTTPGVVTVPWGFR